ncbi:MAG: hypothetical protein ACRDY6_13080 [Acidimicrobiia bacterium]
MNLDDLELELRKLPGVRSAGFTERDDMFFVQVHAGGDDDPGDSGLAVQASRIAVRHSELPVTVELVRWRQPTVARRAGRPPSDEAALAGGNGREPVDAEHLAAGTAGETAREPRLVLVAVLVFPDADEVEVHLTRGEQRTIGRAPASGGAIAAVQATVEAVQGFCSVMPYVPGWARTIETTAPHRFLVAVALYAPGTRAYRYGLAPGDSESDAAARATLHALNRVVALELQAG